MTVRRARVDEVGALLQMERAIAEAPHWTEAQYREAAVGEGVAAGDAGSGSPVCRVVLVAEEEGGGALAGFAVGSCAAGEAELESVVVRAEWRRRGVGEALCRGIMAWAGGLGAATLGLEVRAGSVGALRLYERVGLRRVGWRRGYYRDPVDDAVLLRMALDEVRRNAGEVERNTRE